jgi:hypothetical protein
MEVKGSIPSYNIMLWDLQVVYMHMGGLQGLEEPTSDLCA